MSPAPSVDTETAYAWAEVSLDWQKEAACRGLDAELFFPSYGDDTARAKAVCGVCPVRTQCLAYAVANGERFGIWGGLTPKERQKLDKDERTRIVRRALRAA